MKKTASLVALFLLSSGMSTMMASPLVTGLGPSVEEMSFVPAQQVNSLLANPAVEVGANLPFEVSESFETAKWYNLKISSRNIAMMSHADDLELINKCDWPSQTGSDYLWCLVGNADSGYKIYNKTIGAGKILAAPVGGGFVKFVDEAAIPEGHTTAWDVVVKKYMLNGNEVEGYVFMQHGGELHLQESYDRLNCQSGDQYNCSNVVFEGLVRDAEVPVTVSANFENAEWYTIHVANMVAAYNENDGKLNCSAVTNYESKHLWCFVGNTTDGYKVYNQQAGSAKLLVAPAGADEAMELLDEATVGSNYTTTWDWVRMNDYVDGKMVFRYLLGQHGTHRHLQEYYGGLRSMGGYSYNTAYVTMNAVGDLALTSYINTYEPIVDCVGGYSAADFAVLQNLKSSAEIAEFEATHTPIAFDDTKFYRLQNDLNKDMLVIDKDASDRTYAAVSYNFNTADVNGVWSFEKTVGEGYNFKHANTALYASGATTDKNSVSLVDQAQSAVWTVEVKAPASAGRWSLTETQADGETIDLVEFASKTIGGWSGSTSGDSYWYLQPVENIEVALNAAADANWASLYLPFAVTASDANAEIYVAQTPVSGNEIVLTKVDVLPANTGAIIKGNADRCTLNVVYDKVAPVEGSLLKGTNVEMPKEVGVTYLMLGKHGEVPGLYLPKDETSPLLCNKAYLEVSTTAPVNGLRFVFGEATGVDQVRVSESDVYYNMMGVKVAHPTRGLYIKNGKKVFIK